MNKKYSQQAVKPLVRGSSIYLREAGLEDSAFILELRTNPKKSMHISKTKEDIQAQHAFMKRYFLSTSDFYFIMCNWQGERLGTVRIYNTHSDSFCWGSWLIATGSPASVALESAVLVYEFAFLSLHYRVAKFDVRKENASVVRFHEKFGATRVGLDSRNLFFELQVEQYLGSRHKFKRFFQPG